MAIQPIDLQTLYSQMDKVSKNVVQQQQHAQLHGSMELAGLVKKDAEKKEAIEKIADIAVEINENVENIGARRLHTVMEILLEDISFNASDRSGQKEIITADFVEQKLMKFTQATDLSKFIL